MLPACDKAVTLAPDNGRIRESRAIARALGGDLAGAADDLAITVQWAEQTERSQTAERDKAWLADLRAGSMPFTKAVLDELY